MKHQKKEIRVTVRLTPEQYESIRARAETAQLAPSTYIRSAAMRHKIVVVDGLRAFTHELKGVGRNLNRLTVLANEGRFRSPDLSAMTAALERIYDRLGDLAGREKH